MLDIIIVNYNSTSHLLCCLSSVYDSLHGVPVKIFVQDNASEDDVNRVKGMFPQVILLRNSYNIGFSKAVNKALGQGKAPYTVLLNPDTYVEDNFFESVLQYMEANPNVGIIGPKVLNHDRSIQGSARSFPTPLTALFGRSSVLTKWFPENRISCQNVLTRRSDGITPMEVDWISGACMVVRRKALDDVSFMDERFFMYWEDADLCRRMWQKGWKVVYFPRASVVHYVGVSSERVLIRSIFEFHKSSYKLFDKYKNPSFWFMKPLVIAGLSLRVPFVLASNAIRVWTSKRSNATARRKAT